MTSKVEQVQQSKMDIYTQNEHQLQLSDDIFIF